MESLKVSGLTWKFHFVTIFVVVNLKVMFRVRYVRSMLMVYLCTKFHMPSSVFLLERKRKNFPAVAMSLIHYSAKRFTCAKMNFCLKMYFLTQFQVPKSWCSFCRCLFFFRVCVMLVLLFAVNYGSLALGWPAVAFAFL